MSNKLVGIPLIDVEGNIPGGQDGVSSHVRISKIFLYSTADQNAGITYGNIPEKDDTAYDITQVVTELEITESIYSLAVVGSLTIIDNFNFFHDARIHGQEKIFIDFRRFDPATKQYDSGFSREFLVTNLRMFERSEFRAAYTLEFASPHIYWDNVKRVSRAYGFTDVYETQANDIAGSDNALKAWRQKYTNENTSEKNCIGYGDIFEITGEQSDLAAAIVEYPGEPNKLEYPEDFIYHICRNDLELPVEKVWLYGRSSQLGPTKKTSANRMKIVVPNWKPLQTIKWIIRNTFSEMPGQTGHPWFCYDTLIAGIRIEPYSMLIWGGTDSENKYGPGTGLEASDIELYTTGRSRKKIHVDKKFIYNPQFLPEAESVDYFDDMHRKILEMKIGFSFDQFTKTAKGAYSSQEWYVDIATKFVFPNLYKLLHESRLSHDDSLIQMGRDTISPDHFAPYSRRVGPGAVEFQKTNYTYFVPYNTALHGKTSDTHPYNSAFGIDMESLLSNTFAPGDTMCPAGEIGRAPGTISERERAAMDYYISKGYTPEQAAGIVGNLSSESGLNPNSVHKNDGTPGVDSVGIAQWQKSRKTGLESYASSKGTDYRDFNTQLEYVDMELTGSTSYKEYAKYGTSIKSSTSVEAATIEMTKFEKFQGYENGTNSPETQKRIASAKRIYSEYTGSEPPTTPVDPEAPSVPSCSASGTSNPNEVLSASATEQKEASTKAASFTSSSSTQQSNSSQVISEGGSPTKTSQQGIDLIKEFEGKKLTAYRDAVGVWTIGYGHTKTAKPGMTISDAQAEELLKQDVAQFESCVRNSIAYSINQNQFDALVSFSFNLGCGSLKESTLRRKLNAGDVSGAADEFMRWDKAGGKVLSGLTRRRTAERSMFLGGGNVPPPPDPGGGTDPGEGGGGEGGGEGGGGGTTPSSNSSEEMDPKFLGRIGRTGDMISKNMDFMQHQVKVLGDFRINPGLIMEIEIQKSIDPAILSMMKGGRDGDEGLIDRYLSGRYFVSECTHVFAEQTFHTFATINRDSSSLNLEGS